MSERQIQSSVRIALGLEDRVVLFRNNCGAFNDGNRLITFGLGKGSSDLVGICDGRFFALEIKMPGKKPTAEQLRWMGLVRRHGGFACVVTSVEDAKWAVIRCRNGESE